MDRSHAMFYSERLPSAPPSSAAARRIIERIAAEVDEETMANLRLLVSEVVTNAIEHVEGDAEIGLDVEVRDGRVRVEVTDPGPGFEYAPRVPQDPRASGWGLHFVDRLADRWGMEVGEQALVWFELPARVRAPSA